MTNRVRRGWTLLVGGTALGLVLRLAALWVAPRFGYLPDHLDFMAWSTWAATHGTPAIYDMEPELVPLRRVAIDPHTQRPATYLVFAPHACNYPPFGAWMFWLKGMLWHALDADVRTIPAPPALVEPLQRRGLPTTLQLRTVDTPLARAIDALPSFAFDAALALGVVALVRLLRRPQSDDVAGAAAFALLFASPVVVLDATLWGQSDSLIASMLVWCLAWWLRGRWVAAGAAYGLALVTKPQAILFAPVLAFAALALRYRQGGSWRQVIAALRAVPAALLVAAIVAAPFMVHDAGSGAGAWRWFERSWVATIGSDEYAYTTMNAFNVWWLDLLWQRPWTASGEWWGLLASTAPMLGVTKDTVGWFLLGLSLALGALRCAGRRRWDDLACIAFAFVVLLSAFLLPTRVHERYVFYCIPFMTVLAVHDRRWRVPWVVLSLVGTAEMLSYLWVAPTPGAFALSGLAAAAAVCMLPWAFAALSPRPSAPTMTLS